jgi:hypothetical protein
MNIAKQIEAGILNKSFAAKEIAMNQARELAVSSTAADCVQRTFWFIDGSRLAFNADSIVAHDPMSEREMNEAYGV